MKITNLRKKSINTLIVAALFPLVGYLGTKTIHVVLKGKSERIVSQQHLEQIVAEEKEKKKLASVETN